jgi:hypothetical protein
MENIYFFLLSTVGKNDEKKGKLFFCVRVVSNIEFEFLYRAFRKTLASYKRLSYLFKGWR